MEQTNTNRVCKKHSNSSLEFIQVKNVNQIANKNMFYCSSCINQDLSFKGVDHILINQITTDGETNIIQKWPPIDNQQIIEQLIQVSVTTQSYYNAEQTITTFFSTLKNEISNHIDTCQKKMVNTIKNQSSDSESILKEYQAISEICELRKLLLSGNQADLYAKEQQCREFIISVEQKNAKNTEKLQDLLDKSLRKQPILNIELPNQIKQSILTFIDQINFFNSNQNSQSNEQNKCNSISDKIMKLISNKSNFCSDEFLKEIQNKITELNCLFSSLSFEKQFKENKQPIQFEALTNEQLDLLDEQVKHLSSMKRDNGYIGEIKNSKEVKSLRSVLNIKANFIERNFINDFEEYLIETYPYLRSLSFDNMITETDRFNKMINVSQDTINKMLTPSEQMNNPIQDIPPVQQNLDKINIMENIQIERGDYNNGSEQLVVNKQNNEIEMYKLSQAYSWMNCVSNIILERDKKYVFRFFVQKLDQGQKNFMIGLMKSADIHSIDGYNNRLSCFLVQRENVNVVSLYGSSCGIDKNIKGNELMINPTNNEQIELRVCLQEQVLEVLEYPNYTVQYGVINQYQQNLINFKDLRLYIGLVHSNQKIILKSAHIVNSW